jgi:hypothetical protein
MKTKILHEFFLSFKLWTKCCYVGDELMQFHPWLSYNPVGSTEYKAKHWQIWAHVLRCWEK